MFGLIRTGLNVVHKQIMVTEIMEISLSLITDTVKKINCRVWKRAETKAEYLVDKHAYIWMIRSSLSLLQSIILWEGSKIYGCWMTYMMCQTQVNTFWWLLSDIQVSINYQQKRNIELTIHSKKLVCPIICWQMPGLKCTNYTACQQENPEESGWSLQGVC